MLMIDEAANHVMRSHVRADTYVTLAWPKEATLDDLDYIKDVVNLQLDTFRKYARRKMDANAEYESWLDVLRLPKEPT